MDERLFKRLMTTIRCSECGEHYEGENVKILGHYDDLWFLNVYCPGCQTQGLVAAVLKEGKPLELVTDLTEWEYAKFREMAVVGADDVLDLHSFLKEFNGDFSTLFSMEEV
jgi:ribosomal protein S27E